MHDIQRVLARRVALMGTARARVQADADNWAQWLADAMRRVGINRAAELSKSAGINESVLSRWLRGESLPSTANLQRLVQPLHADYDTMAAVSGHRPGNGQLPPEPPPLEHAIRGDNGLAAGQKDVMLAILREFRSRSTRH